MPSAVFRGGYDLFDDLAFLGTRRNRAHTQALTLAVVHHANFFYIKGAEEALICWIALYYGAQFDGIESLPAGTPLHAGASQIRTTSCRGVAATMFAVRLVDLDRQKLPFVCLKCLQRHLA